MADGENDDGGRVRVAVTRLEGHEQVPLPVYKSEGAAGMDLHACLDAPLTLGSLERAAVGTGLRIQLPPGYEAQIRPRSGLALSRGLTCLNTPGTIDSDYRGELRVLLVNISPTPCNVSSGERIAQLVVARVARAELVEVDVLDETERGHGGFGSTGS